LTLITCQEIAVGEMNHPTHPNLLMSAAEGPMLPHHHLGDVEANSLSQQRYVVCFLHSHGAPSTISPLFSEIHGLIDSDGLLHRREARKHHDG
jgi:hypothetical protein